MRPRAGFPLRAGCVAGSPVPDSHFGVPTHRIPATPAVLWKLGGSTGLSFAAALGVEVVGDVRTVFVWSSG